MIAYVENVSRSRLGNAALALGLALAQFRLIAWIFGSQYEQCVAAAQGVLDGRPHWRIYQSRVLAPYIIKALAQVMPSFLSAHILYSILALFACGLVAMRIGDRVAGRAGAIAALLAFHLTFACLLARPWLYAWDFLDAFVYLALVEIVVANRPWKYAALVLAIGILNHEVANFIAIWIIADPVVRWLAKGRQQPLAVKQVAAGAALFVGSFVVVELLRRMLFIEAIGPKIFRDAPPDLGSSFYFTLGHNVDTLGQLVTHFDYAMSQLVPVFVLACIAYAVRLGWREREQFGGLALAFLALIASLLTFGVLLETRIYVVLIALVVLAAARASRPPAPVA